MQILFYTNTLNYRGTSVAVTDYAHYNQEILGNTSIIGYNGSLPYTPDGGTEPVVLKSLQNRFPVIDCGGTEYSFNKVIDQNHIDNFYSIRAGGVDPLPNNCTTSVHAVFGSYHPHGKQYAYVSEWLSQVINSTYNTNCPFVPHMVTMPAPTTNLRQEWNIPHFAKVFGRYGGLGDFDLDWVKETILKVLNYRQDYYFVFANTHVWCQHPQVIFLDAIYDLQQKSNYINSCDVMIHARSGGESFGLAVAEFLSLNKPVIAWKGGVDQNHVVMLGGSNLLYENASDLEIILNNWYLIQEDPASRVVNYHPTQVMNKFQQVFLS
jgi:glycosyltransferase involved in cell wall biosynthesis